MRFFVIVADQISLLETDTTGTLKVFLRNNQETPDLSALKAAAKTAMEETYTGLLGELNIHELEENEYQAQMRAHHKERIARENAKIDADKVAKAPVIQLLH